jgi:hypothetical protein
MELHSKFCVPLIKVRKYILLIKIVFKMGADEKLKIFYVACFDVKTAQEEAVMLH